MGSFSWLFADDKGVYDNIAEGSNFKFLIPREFGGGCIIDNYSDYGYLFADSVPFAKKYDMYELLACWNYNEKYQGGKVKDQLQGNWKSGMKEIDEFTINNRGIGIDITRFDEKDVKLKGQLKYPLKLVTPDNDITYEECTKVSYSDPNQGFFSHRRNAINEDDPNAKEYSIPYYFEKGGRITVKALNLKDAYDFAGDILEQQMTEDDMESDSEYIPCTEMIDRDGVVIIDGEEY